MHDEGLGRFRLLASAIAGRVLDVAPAEGDRAWTDGATVFVSAGASPVDQLRAIAVQASLLGTGSLSAEIVPQLPRPAAALQRYLAVEGHRALEAQELLLPPSVRSLID